MQKSAERVFKLLLNKRLNKQIVFCAAIILVSLLIFFASFRKPLEDLKKLAFEANVQCQSDNSGRCFSNFFTSFAKDHLLKDSRVLLQELQKINPKLIYCHSIAHSVAIAEVEKNSQNWLEIFKQVPDSECSYGYFHGVIEGKYRATPDFEVDSKFVNQVCLRMEREGAKRSCAHAFGHVILVQEVGNMTNALLICNNLEIIIKSSCFQGVFMENVQRDNLSFHKVINRELWNEAYLAKEKASCDEYSGDKRVECWRSLAPVILSVSGKGINGAVSFCKGAPDYASRRSCNREVLGHNIVNELRNGSQKVSSLDICSLFSGQDKEYGDCVKDLVGYVLLTSKSYQSQMTELCGKARSSVKEKCLEVVKNYSE